MQEILDSILWELPLEIFLEMMGDKAGAEFLVPPEASPQPYREPNFVRAEASVPKLLRCRATPCRVPQCMIVTRKSESIRHSESIDSMVLPLLFRH